MDIKGKDQILAQQDQSLKRAEKERIVVAQKFTTTTKKLWEAKIRIGQLLLERKNLEGILEQKEMELWALREYATNEKEKHEHILSQKEKEIAGFQQQIAAVRDELESMKLQPLSFQEELEKVRLELAKKSTEVQVLREAKEEMKSHLQVERKWVDHYLMQQTAGRSSDADYGKEVEVSNVKKCISICTRQWVAASKY